MVQINFAAREVNCKIVYYGPGRCGKTTNLQVVHAKAPGGSTGELVSIATETDRTLYFDFLPLDLGTVAGMRTKFQLYTVPGQVYYDATRKLVLQGADGVVFVADSNPSMLQENIESLENLAKNLKENGIDINDLPLVLQWNKRDLPNAMPVDEMNAKINRNDWPTVEAVAVNGDGVFQSLKVISQQVIKKLNRDQGYSEDGTTRGKRPGIRAAAPPPPPAAAAKAPPPPPPPGAPRPAAPPPPAAPRPAAPPPPAATAPRPQAPPPAAAPRPQAPPPAAAPRPAAPAPATAPKPAAVAAMASASAPVAAPKPPSQTSAPARPAPPPPASASKSATLSATTSGNRARVSHPALEGVKDEGGGKGIAILLFLLVIAGGGAAAWWFFLR